MVHGIREVLTTSYIYIVKKTFAMHAHTKIVNKGSFRLTILQYRLYIKHNSNLNQIIFQLFIEILFFLSLRLEEKRH